MRRRPIGSLEMASICFDDAGRDLIPGNEPAVDGSRGDNKKENGGIGPGLLQIRIIRGSSSPRYMTRPSRMEYRTATTLASGGVRIPLQMPPMRMTGDRRGNTAR